MIFLFYYAIFAITTGIIVCLDHLGSVIKLREKTCSVENKLVLYISTLALSTLMAPLMFLSCVVPSMSDKAKQGLYKGLFES